MSLKTSKGYIGIGKQTTKGIPVAPDFYVKYLDDSDASEFLTSALREGGDDENLKTIIKNLHQTKFSYNMRCYPEMITYFLAYFLGADSLSGAGDPYSHTITRLSDGRPWITIRKKLDTNIVWQMLDSKIESIEISGEAGKEIMMKIDGQAIDSAIDTTEYSPSYEDNAPFVFYMGEGIFSIDGSGSCNFKSFSLKVTITSDEQQTCKVKLKDLADLKIDVEFSADLIVDDTTDFWKKVIFNNTNNISNDLLYSKCINRV